MPSSLSRVPILRLCAMVAAAGLVAAACAEVKQPAAPSETSYPTITITADGIPRDTPSLVPGMPILVVNNDTVAHRIHLDLGDQPGCGNLDTGNIPPGESRLTQPVGMDVTQCACHDHMNHGDRRFMVQLSVDTGE